MYLGVLDDGTVKGIPMSQFQVKVTVFNYNVCIVKVLGEPPASEQVYIAYQLAS